MSTNTAIEWTDASWNTVTGCTKISPGCKNCYAVRMSKRLKAMGLSKYQNEFALTLHQESLYEPCKLKKPSMIFVNSMSDLFHEDVPIKFIQQVFDVMNNCQQHIFQVLTKRPVKAARIARKLNWSENIWMGVTIESAEYIDRVSELRKIPANIRFLSLEPLLTPIPKLPLTGIDWVIVGGESGPGSRPMEYEWVKQICDRCLKREVPFFFKQWGGVNKKKTGRKLDGRTWDGMPFI